MCSNSKFAEVIVDVANSNVDKIFDYRVPEGMVLTAGQRVFVPFGRAQIDGIVIRLKAESVLERQESGRFQRPLTNIRCSLMSNCGWPNM